MNPRTTDGCTGFQWIEWLFTGIRDCCAVHDLGGSNGVLLDCLLGATPGWAAGLVGFAVTLMLIFRPVYEWTKGERRWPWLPKTTDPTPAPPGAFFMSIERRPAMAKSNFASVLAATLRHEGGYVDHTSDPGGATNMGITRRTLAGWRGVTPYTSLPKSEVKNLTKAEASQIYRQLYWDRVSGDELPAGLDLAVFDYGVNSGPDRAIKALQALLGVAADGLVGPKTLAAIRARATAEGLTGMVKALCDRRMGFLERLSTWATFGRGWSSRVKDVRAKALAMAQVPAAEQSAAPIPVEALPAAPKRGGISPLGIVVILAALAVLGWVAKAVFF